MMKQLARAVFLARPKNFLTMKAITGMEKNGRMRRKTPNLYLRFKVTIFLALRKLLLFFLFRRNLTIQSVR